MLIKPGPYKNYRYRNQIWNTREDGTLDISHAPSGTPHLTQQQFKDECDINNILKSYQETGTINHKNPNPQLFGDFSDVPDFRESLDLVNHAMEQFMLLPAKVRSRFENDPAQLVEFCNNPDNFEEAVSLGLADPKPMQSQNANPSPQNANPSPPSKVPKPPKTSSQSVASDE